MTDRNSRQGDLPGLSSELVVQAARLVRAVRRASSQPAGVRVLSLLDQHGPLGVTQLAEADRSSQPTMSGAVSALVERGWVTKQPHPDDARASLVALTPEGAATLAAYRHDIGLTVAARLTAHGRHTTEDVALAVAVLRDVLEPADHEPERGTL